MPSVSLDTDSHRKLKSIATKMDVPMTEAARLAFDAYHRAQVVGEGDQAEQIETLQSAIDDAAEALIGDGCEYDYTAIADALAAHVSPHLRDDLPVSPIGKSRIPSALDKAMTGVTP